EPARHRVLLLEELGRRSRASGHVADNREDAIAARDSERLAEHAFAWRGHRYGRHRAERPHGPPTSPFVRAETSLLDGSASKEERSGSCAPRRAAKGPSTRSTGAMSAERRM